MHYDRAVGCTASCWREVLSNDGASGNSVGTTGGPAHIAVAAALATRVKRRGNSLLVSRGWSAASFCFGGESALWIQHLGHFECRLTAVPPQGGMDEATVEPLASSSP